MKKKIFIAIAAVFFVAVASMNVMISSGNANLDMTTLLAKAGGWDQTWQTPQQCSGCGAEYCYRTHGIYTQGWRDEFLYFDQNHNAVYQRVPYNNCEYTSTSQVCY